MLRQLSGHFPGYEYLGVYLQDRVTPAVVYQDAAGLVPAPNNRITINAEANGYTFLTPGDYTLLSPDGSLVRDYVHADYDALQLAYTPLDYDPTIDGTTDNVLELEAAIAAVVANPVQAQDGNAPVLDGGGRLFCISRPVTIAGVRGLTVQNIRIRMIGTWVETDFAFVASATAINTRFENVKIEGNRVGAGGFSLVGFGSKVVRCEVVRFKGRGASLTGAGGQCKVIDSSFTEWSLGDPEFATDANYTATCIYVNKNDCYIGQNTIARWAKIGLHMGPECKTLVADSGFHPYLGGGDLVQRQAPLLIWAEKGAGGTITGCYLDNGRVRLQSQGVWMNNNFALYDPTRVSLTDGTGTYMTGIEADDTNGPYRNTVGDWKILSSRLRMPDDGTNPDRVPIMDWIDGVDSLGAPLSWPGDYSATRASGGILEMNEGVTSTRGQNDQGWNICYGGPGTGGRSGAGIGLYSASTPLEATPAYGDPPSIREQDGGIYFRRAGRDVRAIEAADTPFFLGLVNSGQEQLLSGTVACDITFPATAHKGWHTWVILDEGCTSEVTLKTSAGSPNSKIYHRGKDGSIKMRGEHSVAMIRCVSNADGNSAVFIVDGDAELDVVRTLGNGFFYLQDVDSGREILVANTAANHTTLPPTAYVGWEIGVTRSPTSSAVATIESNPANPTSSIWNPNSGVDYSLGALETVTVICLENVGGSSAKFIVRA